MPLYEGRDLEADLRVVARRGLAEQLAPVALTTKMPCPAWGISATRCRVGSVLAEADNTVCSSCYARKGRFKFSNVQARLELSYQGLFDVLWTPALIHQVRWYADNYFRLFHSGDLQGVTHLKNLCTVARSVPDVQFWLPTREYDVVAACKNDVPGNLVVRVSAHKIDGTPPRWWKTTSTVVSDSDEATCPAPEQGGNCGECRECWDKRVRNVAYLKH